MKMFQIHVVSIFGTDFKPSLTLSQHLFSELITLTSFYYNHLPQLHPPEF